MTIWRPLKNPDPSYLFSLSESLCALLSKNSNALTSMSDGPMFVFSDYSGQHKTATHEAHSFLITTKPALETWLPQLRDFREQWLPDNRRISFKKANEPMRWRALPTYLQIAGALRGNLLTIMINRRIKSFAEGGAATLLNALTDAFPADTKSGTAEKMFRLASFVALIIAGFRNEDQVSGWISDHDETLDTHDKREGISLLASAITLNLTGWKNPADLWFCTTEMPAAPSWAEDVAAIPDLAAGAYCEMSSQLPTFLGRKTWLTTIASGSVQDQRAHAIGNWLSFGCSKLKHVLLRIEQDEKGLYRSSAQSFAGSLNIAK